LAELANQWRTEASKGITLYMITILVTVGLLLFGFVVQIVRQSKLRIREEHSIDPEDLNDGEDMASVVQAISDHWQKSLDSDDDSEGVVKIFQEGFSEGLP
jgi:hypothetical protein